MTVTNSDVGPCLALRRPESPQGSGLAEGCGNSASFTVASVSNGFPIDHPERANEWRLVFGRAPETAVRVTVTSEDGLQRSAPTIEGPAGVDGDFYLLELQGRVTALKLEAFDAQARRLASAMS
jgi:hypothetical protein